VLERPKPPKEYPKLSFGRPDRTSAFVRAARLPTSLQTALGSRDHTSGRFRRAPNRGSFMAPDSRGLGCERVSHKKECQVGRARLPMILWYWSVALDDIPLAARFCSATRDHDSAAARLPRAPNLLASPSRRWNDTMVSVLSRLDRPEARSRGFPRANQPSSSGVERALVREGGRS
jgi:hypothetical protein